jgi:hypothetical protein
MGINPRNPLQPNVPDRNPNDPDRNPIAPNDPAYVPPPGDPKGDKGKR